MQFFVMNALQAKDFSHDAHASGMQPQNIGDARRCPVCNAFVGGFAWLPPYRAEITVYGQFLGDIVTSGGMDLLVSNRFREGWEEAGLRGIDEFSPLERLRMRPARFGRRPLTYFHVTPRYFGTRVDMERSHFDYERDGTCPQCHSGLIESIRKMAIDEASWTGEDLFIAWGKPGSIIVTDRVRQLRDKYGLTNMNLTPVEEYFWDPYHKWTPFGHSMGGAFPPVDEQGEDPRQTN